MKIFKKTNFIGQFTSIYGSRLYLYKNPSFMFYPFAELAVIESLFVFFYFPLIVLIVLSTFNLFAIAFSVVLSYYLFFPLFINFVIHSRVGLFLDEASLSELGSKGIFLKYSTLSEAERKEKREKFRKQSVGVIVFSFLFLFYSFGLYLGRKTDLVNLTKFYVSKAKVIQYLEFSNGEESDGKVKHKLVVEGQPALEKSVELISKYLENLRLPDLKNQIKSNEGVIRINEDYKNLPFTALSYHNVDKLEKSKVKTKDALDAYIKTPELELQDTNQSVLNLNEIEIQKNEEPIKEIPKEDVSVSNTNIIQESNVGLVNETKEWRTFFDLIFALVLIVYLVFVVYFRAMDFKEKRKKQFERRDIDLHASQFSAEEIEKDDRDFSYSLVYRLSLSFAAIGIFSFLESDTWRELYKAKIVDLFLTTIDTRIVLYGLSLSVPFASTSLFLELKESKIKWKLYSVYFALVAFLILNSVVFSGLWYMFTSKPSFTPVFFSLAMFFLILYFQSKRKNLPVSDSKIVVNSVVFSLPFSLILGVGSNHSEWMIPACLIANIIVGILFYLQSQKVVELNVIGNEGTEEDQIELVLASIYFYLQIFNLVAIVLTIMDKLKRIAAAERASGELVDPSNVEKEVKHSLPHNPVSSGKPSISNSVIEQVGLDDNLSSSTRIDDDLSESGRLDDNLSDGSDIDDRRSR
jgi:hypothetical protein